MSGLFRFGGDEDFFPGGSMYPNPKVYFPPSKRLRISALSVFSGFEQNQASIEDLPDECLFEILRRLPSGRERSICACVSKRWLTLLSNIHTDELKNSNDEDPEIKDVESEEGCLSRSLEGKKATDTRLTAISVGTATRGGLGKLFVRGSCKVTDVGLRAIARGCPSLRVLSLWNLSLVGDTGLSDIARFCPLLEKLDLSRCSGISDKGLAAIAENCPNLIDLTIDSCSGIGNEGLRSVARFSSGLKYVSIRNCPHIGDQGVAFLLAQTGSSLTKIKLQMLNITGLSLAVLGHCGKTVTDVVLNGLQGVNEKGFWVMGHGIALQKLKSLNITSCQGMTDRGLEAVGKGCPDLKYLSLSKCLLVSDNGLISFAKVAPSLESLKLEECHRINQFGFFGFLLNCGLKLKSFSVVNCLGIRDINPGLPLQSSNCSLIRSLSICGCPGFGDASLAALGTLCNQLENVELCGLYGVTDGGILGLLQSSKTGLVKVNLSGCINLTNSAVSSIVSEHGRTLESLNLDGCKKITDASLVAIANNCYTINDLDVSNCSVSDLGIEALASSPNHLNLQIFSIGGCSMVTDKSQTFIRRLGHTLLGLNIQRCSKISSSTIDTLLERLWRCDILY